MAMMEHVCSNPECGLTAFDNTPTHSGGCPKCGSALHSFSDEAHDDDGDSWWWDYDPEAQDDEADDDGA